ncbi:MAG: hypothetical protein ABH833_01230 [Parcubacteria group bacterium]
MNNNAKLALHGLLHAVAVFAYVILVSWLMFRGEEIFGAINNFWGPVAFLLLFVVSAAIVGSLIFVKPILMYLKGEKIDAVRMLVYTIVFLVILVMLSFIFGFGGENSIDPGFFVD